MNSNKVQGICFLSSFEELRKNGSRDMIVNTTWKKFINFGKLHELGKFCKLEIDNEIRRD